MVTLSELKIDFAGKPETVFFGIPDSKEELREMYELRYKVYAKRGYIDSSKYKNLKETDDIDNNDLAKYFIAKFKGQIVGSVRLIQKEGRLPTEDVFDFDKIELLENLEYRQKGELSRLISVPPQGGIYFPRNIVMIFLIKILVDYGNKNDIKAGYAFIKKSLDSKLRLLSMPIHKIDNYKLEVSRGDVLYNYFTQKEDPVVPMYFVTLEFGKYIENFLKRYTNKTDDNIYELKNNLFTFFLKKMRIL